MEEHQLATVVSLHACGLVAARRKATTGQAEHQLVDALAHQVVSVLAGFDLGVKIRALGKATRIVERPLVEAVRKHFSYDGNGRPPGREVACEPRERLPACRLAPGVDEAAEG